MARGTIIAAIEDQLRRAADLISQPLLLEVLAAAEVGGKPADAMSPDADPAALEAALRRLTAMAVLRTDDRDPQGGPMSLTARGEELLRLLHELEEALPAAGSQRSEQ